MGRAPDAPLTEDVDGLSATNLEVESAMNHRRRWTVLRDACFSQEALDASIREMCTSVPLKMVYPEPQSSMYKTYR